MDILNMIELMCGMLSGMQITEIMNMMELLCSMMSGTADINSCAM